MLKVKAGFFDVPVSIVADLAIGICRGFTPTLIEVTLEDGRYEMTDWTWDEALGVATATIWKVRKNNLPREWENGKSEPSKKPLAEGTSFAYRPANSTAVIQYNHHGPRHRLMGLFLEQIGFAPPVTVHPKINQDQLDLLRHGDSIGRLVYTLADITDEGALRGAGVGGSLEQMSAMYGTSISVSIRLKRTKKAKAQSTTVAKAAIEKLVKLPGVRSLRASYKKTDQHKMEMLNLLGSQKSHDLQISESGMELDHVACRDRLKSIISQA